MFDKPYESSSFYSYPSSMKVDVNNAPTADQIRLLREMEQSLQKDADARMILNGNTYSGAIQFINDYASMSIQARAVFDLNGKRHTVETSVNAYATGSDLIVKLRDEIALKIANLMVEDFGNNLLRDNPHVKSIFKNW